MGRFSFLGGCSNKPARDFRCGDKGLFAQGWTEGELNQILGEFQQMYRGRLPPNFSWEVHFDNRGVSWVIFPGDIEPRFFCWLVNYVQYPKGLDFRARSILVVGRATINSDFLPSEQSLIGKHMTFYIPADDKEHDVIFGRVDGQSYKYPFTSEQWRTVQDPRLPRGIDDL